MNRLRCELRAAELLEGRTLVGHAAVFGQHAEIRGGYEAIAPGAFDAVLAGDDDVLALRDHDPTLILGRRANGTLRLGTDDDGLRFEVDLPDTGYAADVRNLVAGGYLRGASFGFLPGKDEMSRAPDGKALRTHTSIRRLLDVSVVSLPAYPGTDVTLRHVTFDRLDNRTRLILARHRARYRRLSE